MRAKGCSKRETLKVPHPAAPVGRAPYAPVGRNEMSEAKGSISPGQVKLVSWCGASRVSLKSAICIYTGGEDEGEKR